VLADTVVAVAAVVAGVSVEEVVVLVVTEVVVDERLELPDGRL
jgi:hypothetical protein